MLTTATKFCWGRPQSYDFGLDFRRLVRCLIRKHISRKGKCGKDSSRGMCDLFKKKCKPRTTAPVSERADARSFPYLDLLGQPRDIHFHTSHYVVLPQHYCHLGWVQPWRAGKAFYFTPHRGNILALPVPVYEPQAELSYGGDTARRGIDMCVAHPKAPTKIAATGATQGAAGPRRWSLSLRRPSVATHFKQAMVVVQAMQTTSMSEVCSP